MRPGNAIFAILICTPFGAACAGPTLGQSTRTAAEGRYPEALAELHALEGGLERRSPRWCARYSLERGLVHLAVGDLAAADRWLSQAWTWVDAQPEALDATDRDRLVTAWRATGRMPGEH